jgi:transposase
LTGGEAHDCPVAERLIDRVEEAKRLLGDKAYDSAELREELEQRGTKPVIPNRCNRKQPFSFSKRLYKLRWRIETAFNRLKDFSASRRDTTSWRETISPLSALRPHSCGGFNLMSLDPSLRLRPIVTVNGRIAGGRVHDQLTQVFRADVGGPKCMGYPTRLCSSLA